MPKRAEPMPKGVIKTTMSLDPNTKLVLEKWAQREGRSMAMHTLVLLRRICSLRESSPKKLVELGLLAASEVESAA